MDTQTAILAPMLQDSTRICFSHVWNSKTAHFRPCFLPIIAALPAIVGAVILLLQALRHLISWRPQWIRPFVEDEYPEIYPEIEELKGRWTAKSFFLAVLCTFGFVVRLAAALLQSHLDAMAFMPVLPWFIAVLEVLLYRPRTVPYAILGVLVANAIAEAILLENHWWMSIPLIVLSSISVALGALAISLMLVMPYRDPHLPAKDTSMPFTTPTSLLRSPEEALNPWQFMTVRWLSPLITIGSKRQLDYDDVWSLPHEFQHRVLHQNFRQLQGTVVRRLLRANGLDLMIITLLGMFEQVANYAAPVLLQLILSSMKDEATPRLVPLTYAGLALVFRLLQSQSEVFNLWFGRRSYERSRGEMITMLYEKTLGRKISFQPQEAGKKNENGHAGGEEPDGQQQSRQAWWKTLRSRLTSSTSATPPAKEPASMGKILNLMRNDVYEVAQRFWEFDQIVRNPLAIIFSVSLVVAYLGWPALLSVALVVLAQIMNAILARVLVHFEKKRRAATDAKLQIISQFVEAIRHLRWYGWQGTWLNRVLTARQREQGLRVLVSAWNLVVSFVNTLSYDLTPVLAFFTYTVIAKKELTIDIAFPALQLFAMMTAELRQLPQLIMSLINAWVAVGRIEDFMAEADLQEMTTEALIGDKLAVENASFAWPGASAPVLKHIDISFPEGLTVICGQVAAGKTALLQSLLGEMDMLEGQLIRPREPMGYCSQTPWLQSMSIRDNILFDAPYEDARYRAVLDACALTPDLAEFKSGDLSLIGENGVGLSGGQKARVALARAVYSKAGILLLDDPLAALDQQTAELIVRQCVQGPLLKGRTTVLITHRTDLVFGCADQIVKIEDGRASVLDQADVALESVMAPATKRPEEEEAEEEVEARKNAAAAVPDKFIEDEYRAHGGVDASIYWKYIKAGDLRLWALTIVILTIYRFFAIGETWFLMEWAEAYDQKSQSNSYGVFMTGLGRQTHRLDLGTTLMLPTAYGDAAIFHTTENSGSFLSHGLPPPEENIKPWLFRFFLLALGQSVFFILSQAVLVMIVYTAAKNMFREVMVKVAGATFRFYDTTPVGRLMNRMTSDIGVIDGGISYQFSAISWMLLSWVSAVVVIASITPAFLVFTLVLAILFVLIFRIFLPTSQSLRRLELVSLTPLMSNFGELLNGLATVRAFGAQSRFQDRVIHVVDTFQKMDHFYWSTQAWLMYRYDILSSLATFLLLVLALLTDLSPGLTAFALVSASKFVNQTHGLCRAYGQLQMEFVSVERVVELLHLEQEEKGKVQPPAYWPTYGGNIEFKDVTIKYAEHLEPALQQVSFTVKGGSKTAVLGRTGSGKSTLALSLLATILPSEGSITIDGVDLAEVDKQLLRTRITFLAQDPVLFPGTMRANLDPVDERTDAECEQVLHRVCERQGWALDTKIESGGKNLSQGQRQLVGLARAVLRRSAVIILDEATASIDRATAKQIQSVLRSELAQSTVITVAHRLEAVENADFCVILGKGKILEQGDAQTMLRERREEMQRAED